MRSMVARDLPDDPIASHVGLRSSVRAPSAARYARRDNTSREFWSFTSLRVFLRRFVSWRGTLRIPMAPVALVVAVAQRPTTDSDLVPIRQEQEVARSRLVCSKGKSMPNEAPRQVSRPGRRLHIETQVAVSTEERCGAGERHSNDRMKGRRD